MQAFLARALYRVIYVKRSVLWEGIISVIVKKNEYVSCYEWLLIQSCMNLVCPVIPSLFSDA
jgi:hypothetical protein